MPFPSPGIRLYVYIYMRQLLIRIRFIETVACQAPRSMGFSRQEYWSALPCPPPGDLPHRGTEAKSSTLQADSLPAELPGKPQSCCIRKQNLSPSPSRFPLYLISHSGSQAIAGRQWPPKTITLLFPGACEFVTLNNNIDFVG